MTIFRVSYSIAIALLFILFVFFGSRTIDAEPDRTDYPYPVPLAPGYEMHCEASGDCYFDKFDESTAQLSSELITPEVESELSPAEQEHLRQVREFETYDSKLEDHLRLMTAIGAVMGILAIAGAAAAFRRIHGVSLGLLLGGIGSLIYAWVEYVRVPGEANTSVAFVIVTIGLVLVLAGGYYFLANKPAAVEA